MTDKVYITVGDHEFDYHYYCVHCGKSLATIHDETAITGESLCEKKAEVDGNS